MTNRDYDAWAVLLIFAATAWLVSACRKQGPWPKRLLRVTPVDIIKSFVAMFLYGDHGGTGTPANGSVFPIDHHPPEKHPRRSAPCPCGSGKKYRECCRRRKR